MKRWKQVLAPGLVCALLGAGIAAFAAAGGPEDPLVSVGYLEKVFAPAVYEKVDRAVADNEAALKADLQRSMDEWEKKLQSSVPSAPSAPPQAGESVCFKTITLSQGQTLTGQAGCELMLRAGTAVCVADAAPGLIDTTGGSILDHGGALQANHLYLASDSTRSVRATAGEVKLLVRGDYSIQ